MDDAERDKKILEWRQKARTAAKKRKGRNLYVITLDPEVLWEKAFRQENPGYIEGMTVYSAARRVEKMADLEQLGAIPIKNDVYP